MSETIMNKPPTDEYRKNWDGIFVGIVEFVGGKPETARRKRRESHEGDKKGHER